MYKTILCLNICLYGSNAFSSHHYEDKGTAPQQKSIFTKQPTVSVEALDQFSENSAIKSQYTQISSFKLYPASPEEGTLIRFNYNKRGYLTYKADSPLKIFAGDIKTYCQETNPNYIGIDISKHFLTTARVKVLFEDLEQLKDKIAFINLSVTEVDPTITEVLEDFIENSTFHYLNIVQTNASKDKKTLADLKPELRNKIISLSQEALEFVKVGDHFTQERIESHQNYYSGVFPPS